jgi:hypothetical protein
MSELLNGFTRSVMPQVTGGGSDSLVGFVSANRNRQFAREEADRAYELEMRKMGFVEQSHTDNIALQNRVIDEDGRQFNVTSGQTAIRDSNTFALGQGANVAAQTNADANMRQADALFLDAESLADLRRIEGENTRQRGQDESFDRAVTAASQIYHDYSNQLGMIVQQNGGNPSDPAQIAAATQNLSTPQQERLGRAFSMMPHIQRMFAAETGLAEGSIRLVPVAEKPGTFLITGNNKDTGQGTLMTAFNEVSTAENMETNPPVEITLNQVFGALEAMSNGVSLSTFAMASGEHNGSMPQLLRNQTQEQLAQGLHGPVRPGAQGGEITAAQMFADQHLTDRQRNAINPRLSGEVQGFQLTNANEDLASARELNHELQSGVNQAALQRGTADWRLQEDRARVNGVDLATQALGDQHENTTFIRGAQSQRLRNVFDLATASGEFDRAGGWFNNHGQSYRKSDDPDVNRDAAFKHVERVFSDDTERAKLARLVGGVPNDLPVAQWPEAKLAEAIELAMKSLEGDRVGFFRRKDTRGQINESSLRNASNAGRMIPSRRE